MGNHCNLLGEGGVDTSLLFFFLLLVIIFCNCYNYMHEPQAAVPNGQPPFFSQEGVQGGDFHAGMP